MPDLKGKKTSCCQHSPDDAIESQTNRGMMGKFTSKDMIPVRQIYKCNLSALLCNIMCYMPLIKVYMRSKCVELIQDFVDQNTSLTGDAVGPADGGEDGGNVSDHFVQFGSEEYCKSDWLPITKALS